MLKKNLARICKTCSKGIKNLLYNKKTIPIQLDPKSNLILLHSFQSFIKLPSRMQSLTSAWNGVSFSETARLKKSADRSSSVISRRPRSNLIFGKKSKIVLRSAGVHMKSAIMPRSVTIKIGKITIRKFSSNNYANKKKILY